MTINQSKILSQSSNISRNVMVRRSIIWGLIFFGIGAVGWVFSVVLTVVTIGKLKFLTYIFGTLLVASLPVGLVGELILWIKKKRLKHLV